MSLSVYIQAVAAVLGAALIFLGSAWLYWPSVDLNVATITIPQSYRRPDIARLLAGRFGWSRAQMDEFELASKYILWDKFSGKLADLLAGEFYWNAEKRESFLSGDPVLVSNLYLPGRYLIDPFDSPSVVAEKLADKLEPYEGEKRAGQYLKGRIGLGERRQVNIEIIRFIPTLILKVSSGVSASDSLLPDLTVLPPEEIEMRLRNGRVNLVFNTTYFNIGLAPLELVAESPGSAVRQDYLSSVYQRIIRKDGSFIDQEVGIFLWHEEHLHYHFADFIDYSLEKIDGPGVPSRMQKSTYCIRDVSRLAEGVLGDARYRICGKYLQGVSVGWGDTYFRTYDDQNFDVTGLSSGLYRLRFRVNPAGRLQELSLSNNESSSVLRIDMAELKAEVISISPKDPPKMDHVYIEQDFKQ